MSNGTLTYSVPDVSCEHCRKAISSEVSSVAGIASVDVDLAR
jgi:copper chaperone CopZ